MAHLALQAWMAVLQRLEDLCERDGGQALVEYGIILGIVSIVAVVFLTSLGPRIVNTFSYLSATY